MSNKATKKLIKILTISQQELKSIDRNKFKYIIDLNNGKQSYIQGDIYEKELKYQINYFITMYGFMDYYFQTFKNPSTEYSRNYIIGNMIGFLNDETLIKFKTALNNIVNLKKEDIKNNPELYMFSLAYNRGFNLAPYATKIDVEKKYLKLYFELINNRETLDEKLEKTGNSKQLKKIAYDTRKHIEGKRS